jgi:hypothetical protein
MTEYDYYYTKIQEVIDTSNMMATMNMPSAAATAPQDESETAATTVTTKTTNTTTASPKNGIANEDIDTALFGSLNASMADTLTDNIDKALKAGVLTLPLMNDDTNNSRSEKLLTALCSVYWRNVDVFEVYAGRNIFSVGMYPPKRRRAIEQLYNSDDSDSDNQETPLSATKNKKSPLQDISASKMNETTSDTSNSTNKPFADSTTDASNSKSNSNLYPTPEQIPTAQQMVDMTAETESLREQLWQVQRRRNETVQAMNQLEVAEQLADMASSSMQESTGEDGKGIEQVHDSVTAAVVGSEGLEQLQATGKELVEKLEQEKRQRSDGDEDDDDDDVEMLNAAKKKKEWTLEERYQEERKTFSNPESLANVQRMIQEQ